MGIHMALALVAATCLVACAIGDPSVRVNLTGAADVASSYLVLTGVPVVLVCDTGSLVTTGNYIWRTSKGDLSCGTDASTTKTVATTMTNASVTCYKCTYSYADESGTSLSVTSAPVMLYPYELQTTVTASFDLAAVASVNATCSFKMLSPLVNANFLWTRATTGSAAVTGSISTATNSTLVIANSASAGDTYYCHGIVANTSAMASTPGGIGGVVLATYVVAYPPYAEVYPFDKDQYIEGDDVTVACKALGYPVPKVTWLREGAAVNTTSQQTVTIAGGLNVSFTIASLNPNTGRGAYVCIATGMLNGSSYAYASAAKTLHARSKLAPLWPAIGIIAQLAVVAIVIGITEYVRTKKAAAAGAKGGARLDGNKKSPDAVDGSSNSTGGGVSGKSWKAT